MNPHAQVRSIEALEAFRQKLILYISKARATIEEVSSDVQRTEQWIQGEQRIRWEQELRKRTRKLEQARQELFSAQLTHKGNVASFEQLIVHRAESAVDEAESKMKSIKRWGREFGSRADPLVKQMEALHSLLTTDLARAVWRLAELTKILETYAADRAPRANPIPQPATLTDVPQPTPPTP